MEQTIIVTLSFKLINPNKYFIDFDHFNDKLHLVTEHKKDGYIVQSYMMAMTHQYIPKTKNVETSIRWAKDKLFRIHRHVEITKTVVKYIKNEASEAR